MDDSIAMKLESSDSGDEKRRWKIVRLDNHTDVCPPGDIDYADDANGECSIHLNGETKNLSFGERMIRIVLR